MPTALIAEDEPLLAQALGTALGRLWPELDILATVGDGDAALEQALQRRPDVLFLDIRMPGRSGIAVAAGLLEHWDADTGDTPFPALVFVTAYEQYAVQSFETHAIDYLLKPVQPERLRKTVERLQAMFDTAPPCLPAPAAVPDVPALAQAVDQLRQWLAGGAAPGTAPEPLTVLQASVGNVVHMVALDEVRLLEAADKYVRVLTADREYLIRTPLRELLPRLDPQQFWQVHRSHVVRARSIATVSRDEAGKLWLALRDRPERIAVSRLYAHRFKAM